MWSSLGLKRGGGADLYLSLLALTALNVALQSALVLALQRIHTYSCISVLKHGKDSWQQFFRTLL